ncbi:transmembrane protein, distant homology with ydbS [Actinomycetales bacterium JB111]|nr:transmembrane protein, distant homology with ydbS [Actinomycetales bacterium JB111]
MTHEHAAGFPGPDGAAPQQVPPPQAPAQGHPQGHPSVPHQEPQQARPTGQPQGWQSQGAPQATPAEQPPTATHRGGREGGRDGRPSPFSPPGVDFRPVDPRLLKVRVITAALWLGPLILVAAVLAVVVGWGFWIGAGACALILLWLLWLIPRQVRAMGYCEASDDLLFRKGILWRSLVAVPYGRMQYIDVQAGPLDRAFGIATVTLSTASAQTDAKIPGLPADEAARLREVLTSRGEARLAGL